MKLSMGPLLTVLYRGTLEDTASLVGLVNSRASIGLIAFTGDFTADMKKHIDAINSWLKIKGVSAIKINPNLSAIDLKNIVDSPCRDWHWGPDECALAVRLAGLPLPRNFKLISNNLMGE